MTGIGNRADAPAVEREAALAFVAKGDQIGHPVYTESIAAHLDLSWQDAQATLTSLADRGLVGYQQVDRRYRDLNRRGQTYRTFRWWPRGRGSG